jgi:hypothetical protein
MKNLHLLPTSKPSRLTIRLKTGELMFSYKEFVNQQSDGITLNQNQHIYITSDEEIKDGWSYDRMMKSIGKRDNVYSSKIILTTDQNLIKDGVQAIDDEFLEWFVKNPNCEFVDVKSESSRKFGMWKPECYPQIYKIIIPQEEPKHPKVLSENGNELFFDELGNLIKEEPKQELERGITITHIGKQETLDYLQVCKSCGSEEVARCKWVNVNTEEVYSADSGTNLEWCFNCKSETNIIDKEDYETRNT